MHESRTYAIDLRHEPTPVRRGHLDLGGADPSGHRIDVTSHYLEIDGTPWIPVIGEFHFSRYPSRFWRESLLKMKACGITTIATYLFWNLHERAERRYDFSGDLDVRRFVELSAEAGLSVMLRIGPFCHGEMRNGGLPDWIYGRTFEVRSNDPGYLAHVERWYAAIARQVDGLLYSDGGPIVGIQLENEYQHSASPWEFGFAGARPEYTVADLNRSVTHSQIAETDGRNPYAEYGREHIRTLRALAVRHGLDVPLYTATGWGNAAVDPRGTIPVGSGYPYPFWRDPEASPFYRYRSLRSSPDYSPVSYDPGLYPALSAELGPGITLTYDRRPRYPEASFAPMMTRMLGSGSNGVGCYVFHGGSNPFFGHYVNEAASGHLRINYDFQAPIGEYGQIRSHYHTAKLVHFFLTDFGANLAPMETVLPEGAETMPRDSHDLRFAARANGACGYLFVHHFQDHVTLSAIEAAVEVRLAGGAETVRVPSQGALRLREGDWAILPLMMRIDAETTLASSTLQPLARLASADRERIVMVSRPGFGAELVFQGHPELTLESMRGEASGSFADTVDASLAQPRDTAGAQRDAVVAEVLDGETRVTGPGDRPFVVRTRETEILVVPYDLALTAWRVGPLHLVFSSATVLEDGDDLTLLAEGNEARELHVYPAIDAPAPAPLEPITPPHPAFTSFLAAPLAVSIEPNVERITPNRLAVTLPQTGIGDLTDAYLDVDYTGDWAEAFLDGELVADHLYHAKTWRIGLRKWADRMRRTPLVLVFHPLHRDAAFLQTFPAELAPRFGPSDETILEIATPRIVGLHAVTIASIGSMLRAHGT